MRKKIAVLAFLAATILAISAAVARPGPCGKNAHPITCNGVTFCCPNGALCECGPQ